MRDELESPNHPEPRALEHAEAIFVLVGLAAYERGEWSEAIVNLEGAITFGCRPHVAGALLCKVVESWLNLEDWENAKAAGIGFFFVREMAWFLKTKVSPQNVLQLGWLLVGSYFCIHFRARR